MATLTIDATKVFPIKILKETSGPSGEVFTRGQYVRLNKTTGKIELGNATTVDEVGLGGVAITTVTAAGEAATFVQEGVVDLGTDVLGSYNYDADIYLGDTDGVLQTTPGTVTVYVGKIKPVWDGTTAGKVLKIDVKRNP